MSRTVWITSVLTATLLGCSSTTDRGNRVDQWRVKLLSPTQEIRWGAAAELIEQHPTDRTLVPVLVESWKLDEGSTGEIGPIQAFALAAFGPEIVPELVDLLRKPNSRPLAAFALYTMKAAASDAAPALIELLRSTDPDVRRTALYVLAETAGGRAEPGCPLLVELIEDPDPKIRALAARTLGGIGVTARIAAIPMAKRVHVEDGVTWSDFARALGQLKESVMPAIPILIAALGSSDHDARTRSLDAFAEIGPNASTALPKILPMLSDPEGRVRWKAVEAVSATGIETPEIVRALGHALLDPSDLRVRASAASSLAHMKMPPREALPNLIVTLRMRDPAEATTYSSQVDARRWAAKAIGNLGPEAHEAVPALMDLLSEESIYVRVNAAEALGRIGKAASPALASLRRQQEGAKDWERRVAEEATQLISSAPR